MPSSRTYVSCNLITSHSVHCASTYIYTMYVYSFFWQSRTVVLWLIQPMAKLVTLLEQLLDRRPPIVVIQGTTWWETAIIHAELQECGLVVYLPVRVCCYCKECSSQVLWNWEEVPFFHMCKVPLVTCIPSHYTNCNQSNREKIRDLATSVSVLEHMLEQHKNMLNLNKMTALDKLIAGDIAFVYAFWIIDVCKHLCSMLGIMYEPLNFWTFDQTPKFKWVNLISCSFLFWLGILKSMHDFTLRIVTHSKYTYHVASLRWQLWTVALWLTQQMAKWITLLEQHLDKELPTPVM